MCFEREVEFSYSVPSGFTSTLYYSVFYYVLYFSFRDSSTSPLYFSPLWPSPVEIVTYPDYVDRFIKFFIVFPSATSWNDDFFRSHLYFAIIFG